MRLFKVISLALLFVTAACINNHRDAIKSAPVTTKATDVVSGELIVKLNAGVNSAEVSEFKSKFQVVEILDKENNIFLVKDKSLQGNEDKLSFRFESMDIVEFAEPNFKVYANARPPQDAHWLSLWGLKNYGQDSPNGVEGVEGADIGATEAWKLSKGNKSVVVAVIDTGIDYKHPDLAANVWVNQKEKNGIPGIDDDGNGYVDDIHGWDSISDHRDKLHYGKVGDPDPMDDNGHGTHVSGTIGAMGGNGIGVVGINWNVSIMGVKFLDKNGSGSNADEYRAYQYILANDVDVVNGSYGGGGQSKLIQFALKQGLKKGILFVFAAGNSSANNDVTDNFPSNYALDNVMAVAATDSRDQLADFSSYGQSKVHIAAPGVNIMSTIPTEAGKSPAHSYASYSGTSMASPHVAGAAALLIASDSNFKKQPKLIRERLMATAEFKPHLSAMVKSGGRLSIGRAVNNVTSGHPTLNGQWVEVAYNLRTPKYPQEKIDESWKIHIPGAKAIQVHIQFAQIDTAFDVAKIYDSKLRSIYDIGEEVFDHWSPTIVGDTAYLKFSNSLVQIKNGEPFGNFNSAGVHIDRVRVLK